MKNFILFLVFIVFSTWGKAQTYAVQWTNAVGASVSGNTITKNTSTGWGTGAAASGNVLATSTDGWAEVQTTSVGGAYIFAFGLTSSYVNATYTSINFVFQVNASVISIYENGVKRIDLTGAPNPYEVLRVQRTGTTINYLRNGVIVYTSATASSSSLIADLSVYSPYLSIYERDVFVRCCRATTLCELCRYECCMQD